jgi:hypothetical protein
LSRNTFFKSRTKQASKRRPVAGIEAPMPEAVLKKPLDVNFACFTGREPVAGAPIRQVWSRVQPDQQQATLAKPSRVAGPVRHAAAGG